jgi:hypothetical protein
MGEGCRKKSLASASEASVRQRLESQDGLAGWGNDNGLFGWAELQKFPICAADNDYIGFARDSARAITLHSIALMVCGDGHALLQLRLSCVLPAYSPNG